MGEAVEVGVAYQYSAKNQGEPKNFQCNVGCVISARCVHYLHRHTVQMISFMRIGT